MTIRNLREWAKLGAKARIGELEKEKKEIFRTFPELKFKSKAIDETERAGESVGSSPNYAPIRKKRKMSVKARKAISRRMKKFWANKKSV